MSATMEEKSLQRIAGMNSYRLKFEIAKLFLENLEIERDEIKVLYQSADLENIYEQRRFSDRPIDIR